jgi:hypothetical protein
MEELRANVFRASNLRPPVRKRNCVLLTTVRGILDLRDHFRFRSAFPLLGLNASCFPPSNSHSGRLSRRSRVVVVGVDGSSSNSSRPCFMPYLKHKNLEPLTVIRKVSLCERLAGGVAWWWRGSTTAAAAAAGRASCLPRSLAPTAGADCRLDHQRR